MNEYAKPIKKSDRIERIKDYLFAEMPEIEADRAVLLTQSYMSTEGEPMVIRRAKAFKNILEYIPITIRPEELIVGAATKKPRGCQVFPEFSYTWVEDEFDTLETRDADPFKISEETKRTLHEVYKYWKGRTTSELATSYMAPETLLAMEHNIFTPGNYFYNGVGHVTVKYGEVLTSGYRGILEKVKAEKAKMSFGDADYNTKMAFLNAVEISLEAVIYYAKRYAKLALEMMDKESDPQRKKELAVIAYNCSRVPEHGAENFHQALQSFWFIQMLLQTESSGHSVSPGRFDMYMYPFFKKDMEAGVITKEQAQELIDCVWLKLNDLCKVRDEVSAAGFAGYSMFQNLIAGGQDEEGRDATNELSYMCLEATLHTNLPAPSLSVRVWNGTPHDFLIKAATVTRTGVGLPAYYNDEVIIPALMSRGVSLKDARNYNIIGCVEPQCSGKTWGWHDAAFFNMCRPLELVFSNGKDKGVQVGPVTGELPSFKTFDLFKAAYEKQMNYMIDLLVNADNAIDYAHAERAPLPFLASMLDDCIARGKTAEQGGCVYNFTGPQGFGIANVADGLFAIKKLVYEDKKYTLCQIKEALENNYGVSDISDEAAKMAAHRVAQELRKSGKDVTADGEIDIFNKIKADGVVTNEAHAKIREDILALDKFGNDLEEVDTLAREVGYYYTKPLETYKNPRGGIYHAGLYPVSANVLLGAQTGATPDGRRAYKPVADGVSPTAGADVHGPTAAANSVAKLDHGIASNGTLFNMKFHPSALEGDSGLESFAALIRGYFDQKGMHMQFNVVSRETLRDAQKHPEKYKSLVVRVAGYSALFTTLSKSLQDDIINRTEQTRF